MTQFDVHKFGGRSLETESSISVAIDRLPNELSRTVVVVSARRGVTDQLWNADEAKCRALLVEEEERVIDDQKLRQELRQLTATILKRPLVNRSTQRAEIVGLGEKWAARRFAHALNRRGHEAVVVDGDAWVAAQSADGVSTLSEDLSVFESHLRSLISANKTPVVTGFLAHDSQGSPVLLERGGSDVTAAMIGGLAGAQSLKFWKNSAGICSADPEIVSNAIPWASISVASLQSLGILGASVLAPSSISLIAKMAATVTVLDVREESEKGTVIVKESHDEPDPFVLVLKERCVGILWGGRPAEVLVEAAAKVGGAGWMQERFFRAEGGGCFWAEAATGSAKEFLVALHEELVGVRNDGQ